MVLNCGIGLPWKLLLSFQKPSTKHHAFTQLTEAPSQFLGSSMNRYGVLKALGALEIFGNTELLLYDLAVYIPS